MRSSGSPAGEPAHDRQMPIASPLVAGSAYRLRRIKWPFQTLNPLWSLFQQRCQLLRVLQWPWLPGEGKASGSSLARPGSVEIDNGGN